MVLGSNILLLLLLQVLVSDKKSYTSMKDFVSWQNFEGDDLFNLFVVATWWSGQRGGSGAPVTPTLSTPSAGYSGSEQVFQSQWYFFVIIITENGNDYHFTWKVFNQVINSLSLKRMGCSKIFLGLIFSFMKMITFCNNYDDKYILVILVETCSRRFSDKPFFVQWRNYWKGHLCRNFCPPFYSWSYI